MKKIDRPSWDKKTQFPSLMTYANETQIKYVLSEKSEQLDFSEYILHDKDNKEPHFHVVIHLKKPRYISEILAWFSRCVDDEGKKVNTMGQVTRSTEDIDEYLLHSNDQTKHQYLEEDIKVPYGSREVYRELKTEYQFIDEKNAEKEYAKEASADDVEKQLQDIIDGVPFREMARRYGRDYIKNWRSYREYASEVVFQETLDVEKALKVKGSPLAFALEERDCQYASMGYEIGSKQVLMSLGAYVDAQVEYGATYLKDIAELIHNMKSS